MAIVYKRVETLDEYTEAIRLRVEVFIKEQHCAPGWEPDEEDSRARQYIAIDDGKVIATGRARESAPQEFKIERVATHADMRGKGIGSDLMRFILKELSTEPITRVWLKSQTHA